MSAALGDGADGVYDRVEYKYNRQGEVTWKKDQNGTVHEYDYDDHGRRTQDRVTTVGTGVDDAVLRIGSSYDARGQAEEITSCDNATAGSGSTVNQVVFEYDEVGLLSKEYQEHSGAKDGSTPYVAYNYDDSSSAGQFTKGLRPTSLRYPNGRLVHFTYGTSGSTVDATNRLDAIKDDSGGSPGNSLAEYSYLTLRLDSPALKLGFEPIDTSTVGLPRDRCRCTIRPATPEYE